MRCFFFIPIFVSLQAGSLCMEDAMARVKLIFDRQALMTQQDPPSSNSNPFFNPAFLPNEEGAGGNTKSHLNRVLLREEVARLSTPEDPRLYYILDTTIMSRGSFTLFTAYSKKNPGAHLLIKKVKLIASTDIESVMQEITAGLLLQSTAESSKNYNNLLNVARFYEAFVYDNNAWLVLEDVIGVPLKDLPRDLISERFVWTLARTLLETILLFKENSICHSDIQLESILVDNTGRIVIKDFKKAKLIADFTSADFRNVLVTTPISTEVKTKFGGNVLSSFAAYQHSMPNESCTDLLSVGSIITKFTQTLKVRSDATKGLLKYLKAIHDGLDTTVSLDTLRAINAMIFGDIGYDAGIGKTDLNMKLLLGELYRDNVPTRLGTDTLSIQSVVSQYQQAQKSSQTVTVTKTVKPNETITKTATVTRTAPVNIDTTNTDSAIIAENNKKKSSSTSSKTVTASKISSASIVQQELAEAKRKGAKIAAASNTTEDDSGSILTSDMLQTRDFQTNSNEAKEGQDPHMVALQNWLAEQFESSEGFIEQENQEDEKLKKNKNIEESVEIAAENCLEPTEATLTVKNISDGHISVVEEQGTPPTEISIPIETPRLTEL